MANVTDITGNREHFTIEETDRINLIAAGQAEDLTNEDMQLYARWVADCTRVSESLQILRDEMEKETAAKVEASQAIAQAAVENLEAQRDLALARLEAVSNG
jgi:hypothetical protein